LDRERIYTGHNGHRSTSDRFVTETYTGEDDLQSMTQCDIALVLPDDFLVKVDRASMAFGLEVRPPLVDHEFLELAASIPSELKIRAGESKWIFKQAIRNKVPVEILDRKKQGFELPVDRWLRGPLQGQLAETIRPGGPCDGILDTHELARIFESHRLGRSRNGSLLWAVLVLGQWHRKYGHFVAEPAQAVR
jgi:asparagine synthase (glutamine-hydrolysing)